MYIKDWYKLGLLLGISEDELDIIRYDCRDKYRDCEREMFKLWLHTDADASYKKLASALYAVGNSWWADRLCEEHGKSLHVLRILVIISSM